MFFRIEKLATQINALEIFADVKKDFNSVDSVGTQTHWKKRTNANGCSHDLCQIGY